MYTEADRPGSESHPMAALDISEPWRTGPGRPTFSASTAERIGLAEVKRGLYPRYPSWGGLGGPAEAPSD